LLFIFAVFLVGEFIGDQQWEGRYRDRIDAAAMRSPGDALSMAEAGVEQGRLDFAVYRDLLASTLSRADGDARRMALNSVASVLAYGDAFSEDLRRWFRSRPPQVFIYISKGGDDSAGRILEEELKQHGMDVVGRGAYQPKGITKTAVFCYDETVCAQSARFVVNLLQGRGYDAEGPNKDQARDASVPMNAAFSTQGAVSTQGNEATMLLNNGRIDVALAEVKNTPLGSKELTRWLQDALNRLGFGSLKVDGDFGDKTRAALKAFQKSAGLLADGKLTDATHDAIQKALDGQVTASIQ